MYIKDWTPKISSPWASEMMNLCYFHNLVRSGFRKEKYGWVFIPIVEAKWDPTVNDFRGVGGGISHRQEQNRTKERKANPDKDPSMGVLQDEGVNIVWMYTYSNIQAGLWSQEELLTRRSIGRPSAQRWNCASLRWATLSTSFRVASLELIVIRLSPSFFTIFAGLGWSSPLDRPTGPFGKW